MSNRVAQSKKTVKHTPLRRKSTKAQDVVFTGTYRSLGINPRGLGLSLRKLRGRTKAEVADKLRAAARRLFVLANEIEGGQR